MNVFKEMSVLEEGLINKTKEKIKENMYKNEKKILEDLQKVVDSNEGKYKQIIIGITTYSGNEISTIVFGLKKEEYKKDTYLRDYERDILQKQIFYKRVDSEIFKKLLKDHPVRNYVRAYKM